MKNNMGLLDRVLRILLAAVIVVLYFTNVISGTAAIILLVFAIVFIATGFIGSCPVYSMLNVSTVKKEEAHAGK